MNEKVKSKCLRKILYENSENLKSVGLGYFDDSLSCSKCDGYNTKCPIYYT